MTLQSQRLRALVSPVVQDILTSVGQYWPAYAALISSVPMRSFPRARRQNRVTPLTRVCIEGPSGSGNSFFVNAFALANPDVRVAHHHHVASQVKRAVHLGIPAIALLRHPVDCVTSRTSSSPHMIGAMFRQWLRFFRAVDSLGKSVVTVRFETATASPAQVIRYVNQVHGTTFRDAVPEAAVVFQAMDEPFATRAGPQRRNPNRPNADRELLKRQQRPRVAGHRLAPAAIALYDNLLRHAR